MIFEKLKKNLHGVRKNVVLSKYTTFNIGGLAEYFLLAHNVVTIKRAITAAKKLQIPIFIFGGGSNLLVADNGLKGLVVKMQDPIDGISLKKTKTGGVVTAASGTDMKKMIDFAVGHSLQGLEWAWGLPGTFGGAIRGNAGAFGGEMKDTVSQVRALGHTLRLKTFSNRTSHFSYRSSIFKEKGWTILSASVKLKHGEKAKLQEIADSRRQYRKEKHPLEYPSAGSVFKNVAVERVPEKFKYLFLDKIKQDPFPIVPAAWFIIGAGLAGKKIGKAQISKKHSNYIVNLGGAKAKDILKLIKLVQGKVKKVYDIELEVEIQYIN